MARCANVCGCISDRARVGVRDLTPVSKKALVHFLLAFCVGILPALGTAAASSAHQMTMPMDCTDCAPPGALPDDSCAHEECASFIAACASHVGTGVPGTGFIVRIEPLARHGPVGRAGPRYRPDIDDSLYRPPIG